MSATPAPALNFFPYLPLRRAVPIGPYTLVPTSSFEGPWLSAQFEDVAREFIAFFVGPDRRPLDAGAILVDSAAGCDGPLPNVKV
ncbi:MAG: hypothetical protein WHS89_14765, partial [Acidimicrobiales bacterium]